MKYDIDYFIKKFSNIPDDQWKLGVVDSGTSALFYLGVKWSERNGERYYTDYVHTYESKALLKIFKYAKNPESEVDNISDGNYLNMDQLYKSSPRKRIVQALYFLKSGIRVSSSDQMRYLLLLSEGFKDNDFADLGMKHDDPEGESLV